MLVIVSQLLSDTFFAAHVVERYAKNAVFLQQASKFRSGKYFQAN